jgi:branched-chain amino acid transport system ATP-binding protein
MALLELTDVHAAYGSVRALHGVSLRVEEGKIVALLGANGAGKTTTLRAISSTVKKTGGNVLYDGQIINSRSPEDVARLGIAHVPEGRGTLSQLTVWENLMMGAYIRRDGNGVKKDVDRVIGYFPWVGQRKNQMAVTLSGGEQQMLAIARALMLRPRMMLLDEPSLGLAPLIVRDIYAIIETINREEGTTILLVEQNARTALHAAHHAYVIEVGRIAVDGTGDDLARNEAVRKSYLGY